MMIFSFINIYFLTLNTFDIFNDDSRKTVGDFIIRQVAKEKTVVGLWPNLKVFT